MRAEGARALRYFKSDENIASLRKLLADPGCAYRYPDPKNDNIQERIYVVRYQAYQTLKAWGVEVEKPVITEEVRK
jgi:hypothetical protein